jgi:hypothetical protein
MALVHAVRPHMAHNYCIPHCKYFPLFRNTRNAVIF